MEPRADRDHAKSVHTADVAGVARTAAGDLADAAKEATVARAEGLFETNKQAVCSRIGAVAHALRNASSQFAGGEQEPLARAARRAAEGMEGFTRALQERDLPAALESAQEYARRRPALFFAGAFALGVAAARFLKASGQGRRERSFGSIPSARPEAFPVYPS